MLLTLGLGTQFTVLETVVTTIVDAYPDRFRGHNRKYADVLYYVSSIANGTVYFRWVLFGAAATMFLLGLPMCTNGGMYVLQLIDNYAPTFSALTVSLVEVAVITWYYGVDRFLDDIKLMIGHEAPLRAYWKFSWRFIAPLIIAVSL